MVNKVILVGHVGADPEIRALSSGKRVANLRLATNERWRSEGEWTERTEWHNVVVWGRQVDIVEQYVVKGRQLYVEGALRTRSWQDRDGRTRYATEVHARTLQLLGRRGNGGDQAVAAGSGALGESEGPGLAEAPAGAPF